MTGLFRRALFTVSTTLSFVIPLMLTRAANAADLPFGHPPEQDFNASEVWWCRLIWLAVGVALFEATHLGHSAIMRHFRKHRHPLVGQWRTNEAMLSIPVGGRTMKLEIGHEKYVLHPVKERDGIIVAEVICDDHGHLVAAALLIPRSDNGIDLVVAFESKPAGPFRLRRTDNKQS